jgi:2-polyprenyl-3-methyl-5-hydroxy-6-metoxy-1,4-benzoquinol methylase
MNKQQRYDAEWTGWKAGPLMLSGERRLEQVCGHVRRLRPGRLLDLGCGDGTFARLVKAACPDVTIHGCDVSVAALSRTEGLDRAYALDLDGDPLPEADESFDVVTASEVLEHLSEPRHALAEAKRVLKPGGRLLVTVPNVAFWRFRWQALRGDVPSVTADERHLHSYNAASLGRLLESEGFRLLRITGLRRRFDWLGRVSCTLLCDSLLAEAERPLT